MADDNDTPASTEKPTPRRRPPRKSAAKTESAGKSSFVKRGSRSAGDSSKSRGANENSAGAAASSPDRPSRTDRARASLTRATDAVGGPRKAGLIAGGLLAAGAAAAALLSLRSSTPKKGDNDDAPGAKAHQTDGTDSSAQMEAMIADENMVPESTPQA